ncbi:biotin/lipoyl-binding protein, partial [Roseibium sp.]
MPLSKTFRAVALVAVVLPALTACDIGGTEDKQAATAQKSRPAMPVSTIVTAAEDIPVVNELPGRIAPLNIAEVRPRISGLIVSRVFKQGDVVNRGDVLYRIDPA